MRFMDEIVETEGVVRIGAVSYLNARPLVEGLEMCRDVAVSFDVPSRLLGALLEERVDLALAPIVDAVESSAPLVVAPVGCIASDGPTRSVKIFSRTPIGEIRRVVTDPDSKTSVALAKTLLARRFECEATFERAAGTIDGGGAIDADAVLLIGDKVERRPPAKVEFPFDLDLGEAWRDWTGLPFVYAAWVCLASRADEPTVRRGCDLLDRTRRQNESRLAWIASKRAAEHGWGADAARAYLTKTIRTELGEREKKAIERFVVEAAAAGATAQAGSIRWARVGSAMSCPD